MLQILIVVFREILEIALISGILITATKNIPYRLKWIMGGLFSGLIASLTLAFFTDKISDSFEGIGQEIFNGAILITASIMISWTIIWMQKHAKTLSGELKKISHSVEVGKKPLYTLSLVMFFSVLREGAEIVLFTYSSYISGTSLPNILLGSIAGSILGILIGIALYFGMLKIFGKYFFKVTSFILIFISCGIASQAFGFWVNADIIPAIANPIWDSSFILSQNSNLGKFLNIFLGYIEKPSATQLIAYMANLSILIISLEIVKRNLAWFDIKKYFKYFLRRIAYSYLIQNFICAIISLYMFFVYITSRKNFINSKEAENCVLNNQSIILSFWHNRLMMIPFSAKFLTRKNKRYKFLTIASKHGDGKFVGKVMEIYNFINISGSTQMGRAKANRGIDINSLKFLIKKLKGGYGLGITPDGPRGPNQKINSEIINIAKISQSIIFPISYSSSRFIKFNSWDKFKLPLPFSRLNFSFGNGIKVDKHISKQAEFDLKLELEKAMNNIQNKSEKF